MEIIHVKLNIHTNIFTLYSCSSVKTIAFGSMRTYSINTPPIHFCYQGTLLRLNTSKSQLIFSPVLPSLSDWLHYLHNCNTVKPKTFFCYCYYFHYKLCLFVQGNFFGCCLQLFIFSLDSVASSENTVITTASAETTSSVVATTSSSAALAFPRSHHPFHLSRRLFWMTTLQREFLKRLYLGFHLWQFFPRLCSGICPERSP